MSAEKMAPGLDSANRYCVTVLGSLYLIDPWTFRDNWDYSWDDFNVVLEPPAMRLCQLLLPTLFSVEATLENGPVTG